MQIKSVQVPTLPKSGYTSLVYMAETIVPQVCFINITCFEWFVCYIICGRISTQNIQAITHFCCTIIYIIFVFRNTGYFVYKDDVYYCTAEMSNGLYVLSTDSPTYNVTNKRLKISDVNKTYLWHCRLGHINETRISTLWKGGYLDRFDFHSYDVCESCLLGKMPKSPFTGKGERAKDVLGLVHSDVCGPMSTQARGGYAYFITFTDDHSRYGYVFLMRHKSEAFDKFKEFRHEVEKQTGKSIKILRSDRGGEYLSAEFQDHLRENGILSQWTPPGTPQLNGVSEWRNQTLFDMVRSMMSRTTLPISFWGYAIESAMFILNRVPSKSVEQTLYEIWTGKKPSFSYMKIWVLVYVCPRGNHIHVM